MAIPSTAHSCAPRVFTQIMRSWLAALTLIVVFGTAHAVVAAQVTWGAYESNGVGLADGTQVPVGDLVRVGTFTITDSDITAHATDVAYLNSHFVEFGSAHIGDGDVVGDGKAYPAHWQANSTNSSNTLGVAGGRIYYWALDSTSLATATQIGIFTAPSNSRWLFPDDSAIPNTTVTDISDVPHDSTGCLVGGYGVGTSSLSGSPLYNLASVPPPPATPSPTPSPTATATPTPSPSATTSPTPPSSPTITPTPTPSATTTPTPTPSATGSPTPTPPSQLLNLSTRKQVGVDDNVLIGGFIVVGTESKKVLLRGLGPSLPVSGALADPTLELHDGPTTALIASNDNWRDNQQDQIMATGIPPSDELESAIVATLPAKPASAGGAGYTGVLAGKNRTTGIGLLEIYDLASTANSKLANISTRGAVGVGDDVLIGGFIPGPGNHAPLKVLVRALGPSLTAQGVQGALQDPVLELHDANGGVVVNDNWHDASNAAEIEATLPPADNRESAIITTLAPSNAGYTAVVRGANNSIGVALVEVYALN
jgi:hypothetical protein